ncbi:MAG: beta-ketoacyl synthase N-terminal-like domain-containing protein [Chloroflexi bacterium]|jgi:acetyl-CoA C-acetyltransferase|nr:beta-ketoacyl synthase N-terminal-like domain-containing protein [Chloroflexota bacterium]
MRDVAIYGTGMLHVSEHWDLSVIDLAGRAALEALNDAGLERVDSLLVTNMLAATQTTGQLNLGARVADWIGLHGIEAYKVEAACGSGGSGFRAAWMAVGSGAIDLALVVGVEKMTETPGPEITAGLATAADADFEVPMGPSFVALNALIMRRYQHEYGWPHEAFAPFSINAHANGARNPLARLQEAVTVDEYRKARMVSDPINLLDASPIGDGAAAIVLGPADRILPGGRRPRVVVAGSAAATDSIAIHDRQAPLRLTAGEQSAAAAYSMAGVAPQDIDFFELHDAFSIMSALSLEACGFAEPGQGPRLAADGAIFAGGRIPVATFGGLKARGHPVGATGVYQLAEATRQLWGEAGACQVDGARVGMAQNIGGSGATIVTHILRQA